MYICKGKSITDKPIRRAAANGVDIPYELRQTPGVAAGCGKCASMARDLLDEANSCQGQPRMHVPPLREPGILVKRIFFLKGLPNMRDLGKLRTGEDVPEILQCDLDMELDAIPDLRAGTADREAHEDYDWQETQLDLIDQMGPQNYLLSAK